MLEGTLDAFSLPDVFSLLSATRKTGTLHLRREGAHGAVHLRGGQLTGARSDVARQALGRRLVGAGLVDDETLANAVEQLVDAPGDGLGRVLVERAGLDAETVRAVAAEQVTDAVFDLLRWPDGAFAFVTDEPDPDDLGATLPVEQVVEEGRRRLLAWSGLTASVPAPDSVVSFVPAPGVPPALTLDEWQLLSFVDGRRTVSDLVTLSGRGDFAIVGALAALVERGLLQVRASGVDGGSAVLRRQQLLAALEGQPIPEEPARVAPVPVAPVPVAPAPRRAVLPERPEPFTPARRPEHPDQAGQADQHAGARTPAPVASASSSAPVVGGVVGSAALAPAHAAETAPSYVERDPSVNKSLLLRLIAGVRGL